MTTSTKKPGRRNPHRVIDLRRHLFISDGRFAVNTVEVIGGQFVARDADGVVLAHSSNRVELNAMASDQLIELIERKLEEHGVRKVVPDKDLLGDAYQAFHRSKQLQDIFEEAESEFEETECDIDVPDDLEFQVCEILKQHDGLRWDDAVQVALDEAQLDHVREKKKKEKADSGNFVDTDEAAS